MQAVVEPMRAEGDGVGGADEVAALDVHLASTESGYTTGAEILVNGGLNAGPVMPAPATL